jgi:ParB family transcriptional regulator, chromosome partitioning protein
MEHTHQQIMVRVTDLVDSPFNVRRHTSASVDELAALIDSQGLLHPLTVTEQEAGRGKARRMRFGVVAGKRRRRALLQLIEQGKVAKDHEVRCDLVAPERAREISVAENSAREPMHPADEFEAFKAMIDEGRSVEDVAVRFGVPALTVRRRLKLAALSPKLIALYREEGINLDQLMALTLTADHAAQERVWFDARPWDREATALRRVLTAGEVQATGNAQVRFVGIEAYEAADGAVRRDLFDTEQAGWISDPELLRRLAAEKLEGIAELVKAEGWSWVEARVELDSLELRQFSRCEASLRRLTRDESQALDEMKQREAELDAEAQAMNESRDFAGSERIGLEEEDIAAHRAAIQSARQTWLAEDMAHAGAIVTVSREGDTEVIRGLVRESERKAVVAAQRRKDKMASDGAGSASRAARDDGADDASPQNEPRTPKLSDSLLRRLATHRTVALQAALAANVPLALASLAHVFVKSVFSEAWARDRSAMQVSVQMPASALAAAADDLEGSRAWKVIEAAKMRWKDRLPPAREAWFGWLIELPHDELLDLLALCASLTVNGLPATGASLDAAALAKASALNMADWWEPTAAGFLSHVSKVQIVEAVNEASGDAAGSRSLLLLNKQGLVAEAALRLAGKRWLPQPLRPALA